MSELDLNLTPDDPIEFVEVSSEQGVQMLFFRVDPAGIEGEQWASLELSEGRALEACLRIENGPSLHVVYKDPIPEEAYISGETANKVLSSPLSVVREPDEWVETKTVKQGVVFRLPSLLKGLFSKPASDHSLDPDEIDEAQLVRILSQSAGAERKQFWWRPGWLIVLMSAIVIGGFLYFKINLSRTVTATDLLQRADVAEKTTNEQVDHAKHRFINLEERRSAEGAIVAQHKIEIWENRGSGVAAQRLYDQSSKLIGGTWQKADGTRVVYHHGSRPQSQPATGSPDDLLLNLEDIWQLQPSAQSFAALIEQPVFAAVEESSATYVLRYEKGRTIGASQLLKATLTLSKSDLHPIEQTLLVLRGGVLREFRFVEASFELVPLKDVAPKVFEIEPDLTGGAGEPGRPGDWAFRDLTASRVPPSPSTSAPPVASAELEVDVAYLLNRAKADRNEQVNLTRSAGGSLRVEGVVDTQERKNEFLRALAPVSNNPAVKIEIRTVAEATEQSTPGTISVQQEEETTNTVAANEELRAYFLKRDPDGPVDESIRNYSSRMVHYSYDALFHAIELKRLINRFETFDMRAVAPDARNKWLAMIHEHAAGLEQKTALLRQETQPVFFPGAALSTAEEILIQSDDDLARAVERLHKLTLSNNTAVRAALTISAQSSAVPIRSTSFLQSLQRAEQLARSIRRYQAASG